MRQASLRTVVALSSTLILVLAWVRAPAGAEDAGATRPASQPTVIALAGGGTGPPFAGDGRLASNVNIGVPSAAVMDAKGNVFFTQNAGGSPATLSCEIRERLAASGRVTTLAGRGFRRSPSHGRPARRVWLNGCNGLAIGPQGNVYVVEGQGLIERVARDASAIRVIAGGAGSGRSLGDNGPSVRASLYGPTAITISTRGVLFIADTENNRIREVSPQGVIRTIAGSGRAGFVGDGGSATRASLNHPRGIALGPAGAIYIADTENNRIRQVDPRGVIRTVVGGGRCPVSGNRTCAGNITGVRAAIDAPQSVSVSSDGTLYFSAENRIYKVDHHQIVHPIAGDGKWPASRAAIERQLGTVPASEAEFNPVDIQVTGAGDLLVTDAASSAIREVLLK